MGHQPLGRAGVLTGPPRHAYGALVTPPPDDLPRAPAFGIACFAGTLAEAADAVLGRALSGRGGYGVLCNVHVLMTSEREPALRDALRDAWLVFPDGAPVAWLVRRSGAAEAERVGGPDLLAAVLDRGRARNLRHFFYGSTPAVVERLLASIDDRFPGVALAGAFAPPWGTEHDEGSLEHVVRSGAHVVWVGLGAPKQELWMRRHAATLAPALVLGVGAAFDFHAGTKSRAPRWMRQAGLEWLHRFASEPRRLGPRYIASNSRFAWRLVREAAHGDPAR